MRAIIWVLCSACVVGENPPPPAGEAGEEPKLLGVVASPRHGDVIEGSTRAQTIEVAGYHAAGDYRIDVQVLDDPAVSTSWVTIGTTLTASAPSENGQYVFRLLVSPARDAERRWPEGGVVRMRAIGAAGDILSVLFHDNDDVAPVRNGMVLVSPSPTPAEAAVRPTFLNRRDVVDATETTEYYATIDAPPTLADFRTRYGFDDTSEPMIFYNTGDLGIGREMYCGAQAGGGLACYVSNYGEFGGSRDRALADAVARTGSFAAVAMVYQPPANAPNSVQFIVYSATGALAMQAQLDQFGDNVSIPNNCLNCHGGARYDAASNTVTGARFLPFDASAFEFADAPGHREADAAPKILALNRLVAVTDPPAGIRELIDGFGAMPARDFVAAGWNTGVTERKVYAEVVAVACRSCHASLGGSLELTSAESFKNYGAQIADSLCGPGGAASSHDMPSAEVPMRRLWTTPARAYLMDYLDIAGACAP